MQKFVCEFIDPNLSVWLVSSLLYLINFDASIEDNDEFYINPNLAVKKSELCKPLSTERNIYLPAFLLGVWHFIIVNRQNNSVGRDTIEIWSNKPDNNSITEAFRKLAPSGIEWHINLLDSFTVEHMDKHSSKNIDSSSNIVNDDLDDVIDIQESNSSKSYSPHETMFTKVMLSIFEYKFLEFIKSEPLQAFTIATDIEEKQLKVDYFQYMCEEQLASPLSAFGLDDFSYLDDDLIKNSIISYSCRQLKAELLVMNERFVDFIYNEIIGSSSDNRKEPIYDAINDFAKKLDDYINYLKKHLDVDGEYLVSKEDYTTNDDKHSDESTHNTKRAIQSQMMWFYSSTRYLREEVYSLFMKIQEVDISTSVFSNYD